MAFFRDPALAGWCERIVPRRLVHYLMRRRVRLFLAWTVASLVTAVACYLAWDNCQDRDATNRRRDGNWGHVNIDFSGQWLLAAMFVRGEGRHLYDRRYQEPLLDAAYPRDHEKPDPKRHDVAQILQWLVHSDEEGSTLSGPMYPPVHGMLFAPLGLLPPQIAYRTMQAFNLLLTFVAAWLIQRLTRGGVWLPVAAVALILYPGHAGGFHLGQNPIITMTLLLAGWLLLRNEMPICGGLVWGLLAFKPVWAVAFLLVPLLTRRWRFAAGMMLCGGGLALATLPFTGLQPWLDWLRIGGIGSEGYATMRNWIFLSRDLISLPRRWMLDFDKDWVIGNPYRPWPDVLGVLLWLSVPVTTVVVAWKKRREPAPLDGPGAAFVLLGAFFSCYHFMYYDVLLTVLPVTLLFTRPGWYPERMEARRWWPPFPLMALVVLLIAPPIAVALEYMRGVEPKYQFPPYDEFALLALWVWCGWQWCAAVPHLSRTTAASPPTAPPDTAPRPASISYAGGNNGAPSAPPTESPSERGSRGP